MSSRRHALLVLAIVSLAVRCRADVLYTFNLVDTNGMIDGSGSFLLNSLPPTLVTTDPFDPQFTTYDPHGVNGGYILETFTAKIAGYTFALSDASDDEANVRFSDPDDQDVYYNSFVFEPIGGGYGYFQKSLYTNGGEFEFPTTTQIFPSAVPLFQLVTPSFPPQRRPSLRRLR